MMVSDFSILNVCKLKNSLIAWIENLITIKELFYYLLSVTSRRMTFGQSYFLRQIYTHYKFRQEDIPEHPNIQ